MSSFRLAVRASLRTRWIGLEEVKSERPELTDARVVVAGGRGTKGDFGAITGLADALGGAVGVAVGEKSRKGGQR